MESDNLYEEAHIKRGPILSSSTLHYYLRNNWNKVKEKRKKIFAEKVKSLKEIGRVNSFKKRSDQIYLLSELRWFWDRPVFKNSDLLFCTNCFEWGEKNSNEFTICQNNHHTIHKHCSMSCILRRLFNDNYCDHVTYNHVFYSQHYVCLLCHPLFGEPFGY